MGFWYLKPYSYAIIHISQISDKSIEIFKSTVQETLENEYPIDYYTQNIEKWTKNGIRFTAAAVSRRKQLDFGL